MKDIVVFSDRAYVSLLTETHEKMTTETGGVFLGHRKRGFWYVIESIDPGPRSVFSPAYFEYDQDYINHLINKVARLYREPLDLIGLWHRHPGSFSSFSSTDDGTNTDYAKLHADGAISALVNIDPTYRLGVYRVSMPLRYDAVEHAIGDKHIPPGLLKYRPADELLARINHTDGASHRNGLISSICKAASGLVASAYGRNGAIEGSPVPDSRPAFSFSGILSSKLQSCRQARVSVDALRSAANAQPDTDSIELILEAMNSDIETLDACGIDCTMRATEDGGFEFGETVSGTVGDAPVRPVFYCRDRKVYLTYNGAAYEYKQGLFRRFMKEAAEVR